MTTKPTTHSIMQENLPAIKRIIDSLKRPFDTHDFIRAFSQEFQQIYIQMLNLYPESNQPFMTVNQQIGSFLLKNQLELKIYTQGKVTSPNIFGKPTENEQWA